MVSLYEMGPPWGDRLARLEGCLVAAIASPSLRILRRGRLGHANGKALTQVGKRWRTWEIAGLRGVPLPRCPPRAERGEPCGARPALLPRGRAGSAPKRKIQKDQGSVRTGSRAACSLLVVRAASRRPWGEGKPGRLPLVAAGCVAGEPSDHRRRSPQSSPLGSLAPTYPNATRINEGERSAQVEPERHPLYCGSERAPPRGEKGAPAPYAAVGSKALPDAARNLLAPFRHVPKGRMS
jgi:hypothetical protein